MFRRVVAKAGTGSPSSFANTGERGLRVLAAESSNCTSCGAGSCPVTASLRLLDSDLKAKLDLFSSSIKLFVRDHGNKPANNIQSDQEMRASFMAALQSLDDVLVVAIRTENQNLLDTISNVLMVEGCETFYQLAKFMAGRSGKTHLTTAITKAEQNRARLFGEQDG